MNPDGIGEGSEEGKVDAEKKGRVEVEGKSKV